MHEPDEDAPITDAEADALFAPLRPIPRLVLAVSGGPDSTALMHLVHAWSRRQARADATLLAVTVDHGLRPESAHEAASVARQAAALGIAHRTLVWSDPKPTTGLQAAARQARYDHLHEAWTRHGGAILTAHTADDQAETVLMRLARGSGVDGLAAIPQRSTLVRLSPNGKPLAAPVVRSLLGVPRSRLLATLRARGIGYADDPSNRDARFERVRVRAIMSVLGDLGLTRAALVRTAARMQAARSVLEDAADALERDAVTVIVGAVQEIERDRLVAVPDTGVRLLRRLIGRAGGAAPAPDLQAIETAFQRIADGNPGRLGFTLGGAIVELSDGRRRSEPRLRIYREPDRGTGLASLVVAPGETVAWDARFRAEVWSGHPGPVTVGPLGDDWPSLRERHPCLARLPIPAAAARGLPVFRENGCIAAVPHLAAFAASTGDEPAAAALKGPLRTDGGSQQGCDAVFRVFTIHPPPRDVTPP